MDPAGGAPSRRRMEARPDHRFAVGARRRAAAQQYPMPRHQSPATVVGLKPDLQGPHVVGGAPSRRRTGARPGGWFAAGAPLLQEEFLP